MGCFPCFGWAWNVKPDRSEVGQWAAAVPSAEFVESFVIFLYGSTNVFMEHLAAWGDAWTAQDLEHVAISVMFFGGGLVSDVRGDGSSLTLTCLIVWSASRISHPPQLVEHVYQDAPTATGLLSKRRACVTEPT
jgi:hypothetical protein